MNKLRIIYGYIFATLFFILPFSLCSQVTVDSISESSSKDSLDYLTVLSDNFIYSLSAIGEVDTFYRNVRIIQDSLLMRCNKAVVTNQIHAVATGDVVIIQSDSIRVYADSLIYNGEIKLARFFGDVILEQGDRRLYSDALVYDIKEKIGVFENGATLRGEDQSELISKTGSYSAESGTAYFRENVRYRDTSILVTTDSLLYHYNEQEIEILCPTQIEKDSVTIYAEAGIFNTSTDRGILSQNVQISQRDQLVRSEVLVYDGPNQRYTFFNEPVITQKDITAEGDTIVFFQRSGDLHVIGNADYRSSEEHLQAHIIRYNEELETFETEGRSSVWDESMHMLADNISRDTSGLILATGNIIVVDTSSDITILSDFCEIQDSSEIVKAYGNRMEPLLIYEMNDDTLYLIADTLVSFRALNQDSAYSDYFNAFFNVRFIKSDMSGMADSLHFNGADSLFILYDHPVLWSDSVQMSADSVAIHLAAQTVDKVLLNESALVIMQDARGHFNQIAGAMMEHHFQDGNLKETIVKGNAEMLYFVTDSKDEYIGINSTRSSGMRYTFKNNDIEKARFSKNPESKVYDYDQDLDFLIFNLQGFNWAIDKKPTSGIFNYRLSQ
jgi:lipopolysaccharide export system protein LptA